MNYAEELEALRKQIDLIDEDLLATFGKRMGISSKIADVKTGGNIAVTDLRRESAVVENAKRLAAGDLSESEITSFMRTLISLSKLRQTKKMFATDNTISFPDSSKLKEGKLTVAYQGLAGAWGEHAAFTIYNDAGLKNYDYFEDVFRAVKSGEADFGVIPIENSQTGAIGEVYDLLRRNGCYIVGQVWITVAQCLLAKEGTAISDIREIFSHPEGFGQCRRYLKNRNWELTACRNTAFAAKLVSDADDNRVAAIGSRRAAIVHGLSVVAPDIMDNANNKTRFIAIAAEPFYDGGCDTTSITFSTAHRAGSLCSVLEAFMLAGINLSRIESRPVSADKYRFFADLQANVLSGATWEAIRQAAMSCDYFEVLGCYKTSKED